MMTPPDQRPEEDDDFFDDDEDDLELGNALPIAGARGRQALRVGDGIGGEHSEPHASYADYADDFGDIDDVRHAARRHELRDAGHPEGAREADDNVDADWLEGNEGNRGGEDDDDDGPNEARRTERRLMHPVHDAAPFTAAAAMGDEDLDDGIGELPAVLACEAGRLTVSVREIRALQAGQVIDLGRPLLEGVSLMLDGREIARGMLVDLEGRFGIMLTALTEEAHHG
ncbi:hypothetical protein MW7_014125 [Imbroritus primus]|uniref:Uncharacterized protein n=1 Tax=Imbroritus primus TaxID=3058603 RepID=A0ACD3SLL6_9BURK|nr:hypothetical protein MW7_014125 [Burkholderiaceae bacterium PBA]